METIRAQIEMLTCGFLGVGLIPLPNGDKTHVLLQGLKVYGFISKDTKLAHFRVLFGIPIQENDVPFEPIKWRKNQQLLRYFIYNLFPEDMTTENRNIVVCMLFANKHGEKITLPKSDKRRLDYSSDFPILRELINDFKE